MWVQVMTVFDLSIEGIHLRGEIGMGEWGYGLRSIYIDDVLYSISDEMLIASSLSDLSEVNVLLFGSQSGSWDEAHFGASGVREW
jgi:hypothetical protein